MTTFLALAPVLLIAAFAMYVQYRSLSDARRRSPLWKTMCILPVLGVTLLLLWIALRA